MVPWKDKALKAYKKECFKQTMPYRYEIAFLEKTRGVETSGPLVSALGNVIYFPEISADIFDFRYVLSDYIVFVHRDGLPAASLVDRLLEDGQGADIIYPDEDFFDFFADEAGKYSDEHPELFLRTPWRKPDFSPDTLMSFPYIETCFAVRTAFAKSIMIPPKAPGISDEVRIYDFLLRCLQKTDKVVHVPEVLYHRFLPEELREKGSEPISDADIYDVLYKRYNRAGYCLARDAAKSRLGYDDVPEPEDGCPLVSVIIPSKDHYEMLRDCIEKVVEAKDDLKIEFIVVDNGSSNEEKEKIDDFLKKLKGIRYSYIYEPADFDFSHMCNMGAEKAKGSYLLFLNDDVEADDSTFLKEMVKLASLPHVGAVGVKLLYPDWESIQHVGITDINRGPSHKLSHFNDREIHYFGRNRYLWDVLAVTGACLMVEREKYFNAGGFHDKMKVGYNDVDLCVKLYEKGYYNVVDCTITLIHHESVARGIDAASPEKRQRLYEERECFYKEHPWIKEYGDPFYHKKLDHDTTSYGPAVVANYQVTDYRNACDFEQKLIAKPSNKVSFNIESFDYEVAIDKNAEDAYVFEGWSLMNKRDNIYYARLFCLIPEDENGKLSKECIECKVSPKYRDDVRLVFPEAKNARLAGFVCRIPVSKINSFKTYRMAMAEFTTGWFHKYITLGEKFSVERGIIKDE